MFGLHKNKSSGDYDQNLVKLKCNIDGLMVIREKSNMLFILNMPKTFEILRC